MARYESRYFSFLPSAWVRISSPSRVTSAMNAMKRKEEVKPAPVAETPADIMLLTEIRDLLKK